MGSKKIVMPAVNELAVRILQVVVDKLPRGTRPATDKRAGEAYSGVLQKDVATAFYALAVQKGIPLSDVKNETCTFENPCGKCRRCLLQVTAEAAQAEGKIVKVPRGKDIQGKDGRMVRKTWVTYYRPGELKQTESVDYSALLAAI